MGFPYTILGVLLFFRDDSAGLLAFAAWAVALAITASMLLAFALGLWVLAFTKAPVVLHKRAIRESLRLREQLAQATAAEAKQRALESLPRLVAKDFRQESRLRSHTVRGQIDGVTHQQESWESYLILTVENDPVGHSESCIASYVGGFLEYTHEQGEVTKVPARWIRDGSPADRPPVNFDQAGDFGIGTCRDIVIAVKPQGDSQCYAVTDAGIESKNLASDTRGSMFQGKITATLRLRAVGVDIAWRLWFYNPYPAAGIDWVLRPDGLVQIETGSEH